MSKDDTTITRTTTTPASGSAERDLDRMLDLVAAPAPSETLRARLLRDFNPDGADRRQGASTRTDRPRTRFGVLAMAAALVIGIALGVMVRPGVTPEPVATTAPAAPASQVVTVLDSSDDLLAAYEDNFDGEIDDTEVESTFAEGAPDSAAFMLAALDLGLRANDPASDDTGSFEGVPLE
jgi:hypothetical protein